MQLPSLSESQKELLLTTTFKGYNHNESVGDGEMYDMKNLSGRSFPLLDQRKKRIEMETTGEGQLLGVDGRAELVYIKGTSVYYDNQIVSGISVSITEAMLPKKITSMGAYVCIWPDKVYFNTVDLTDCGQMEYYYDDPDMNENWGTIFLRKDTATHDVYDNATFGIFPSETALCQEGVPITNETRLQQILGSLWIDIRNPKNHIFKTYNPATLAWEEVPTMYTLIQAHNCAVGLNEGDTITLSGLQAAEYELLPGVEPDDDSRAAVAALNGERTIYKKINNHRIIVNGTLTKYIAHTEAGTTRSINRLVPDLDYITESQNRLWGCKYGVVNGNIVNEIRCCKQGDFKNWGSFIGIESDSFAAGVGTDGPFTGAASQRGYPVFFKENCIHRVTGTTPSTYTISTISCRGAQEGSWRSVVVANELIYYKSREDVMAFDGSMPYSISAALGNMLYSDARAGQANGNYYISMKDTNNEWSLFVYNSKEQTWYKEDDKKILEFGTLREELYAIDENENKMLMMTGTNPEAFTATIENEFEWYAVFGIFGTDYANKKYLSRFNIRLQIEEGAELQMFIQYDHNGVWEEAGEIKGQGTRTFTLPVVPRRCDHLQIKLSGTGRCRIYSIGRILEVGSDG